MNILGHRRRGRSRSPLQRERDLAETARLYAQGKKQWEIGLRLKVTQQQVSHDLKVIMKRWRESASRDFDEARSRELGKLDELERTYWEAWQRYQDFHFLEGIGRCIDRRVKLLGLDADRRIDVTERIRILAVESGLDPDEAVREAQRIIKEGWLGRK